MGIEIDEECLSKIAGGIDWNSVSPVIRELAVGPSYQLLRVVHRLEKTLRKGLIDFDLTNTQFSMLTSLMMLTKSGKIVTQMDLANYLDADKMMVSEVLRTLEKKGHITRERHPVDRRAKSIVVTEKGLTTIDVALKKALILEEEFYSVLGDEKDDLIKLLKKLI